MFYRSRNSFLIKLFCLFLLLSTNVSLLSQDQDLPEDVVQKIKEVQDELSVDDQDVKFDTSEFEGAKEGLLLQFLRQPTMMAERLPDECKNNVVGAWEDCQHAFAVLQHPILFLLEICQENGIKLSEILEDQKEQSQYLVQLIKALRSIQNFLNSENFQFALQYGMFPEQLKEELSELSKNYCMLFPLLQDLPQEIKDSLIALKKSLGALDAGDFNLFMGYKFDYLKPRLDQTFVKLDKAQDVLNKLGKRLKSDQDVELQESIKFWQTALSEFSVLKQVTNPGGGDGGSGWGSLFENTVPFVESGYILYRKFLELYKADNPEEFALSWSNIKQPKKLALFFADQTLRVLMLPVHFLKRVIEINKLKINPAMKMFLMRQSFVELYDVYVDPDFYSADQIWPLRTIYRIAPAWGYCQAKNYWNDKENYTKNMQWLPAQEKPFQKAIWLSIKDGYEDFALFVENILQRKVSSKILKNVESKTLGLVKPSLVKFIFDVAVPMLTYKYFPKDVANLEKENVFNPRYWDWNYVGNRDFEKMSDAEYIENRIVGYLATSLGSYFGKAFAKNHNGIIKSLLAKGNMFWAKLFVGIGVIDQETLDSITDLGLEIKEEIKVLLGECSDPMLIMAKQMFFSLLIQCDVLTQLEVAEFEQDIIVNQINEEHIDLFTEKIVSTIVDNFVIKIGGWVGSGVTWLGANVAMKYYGPFYPKLKEYGHNTYTKTKEYVWGTE